MNTRSAMVLVVDRLGAGFLGPYGNTWIETPEFCRLASESILFEQAIIDSPHLETICRSYWQGLHAMCARSAAGEPETLPARLGKAGVHTELLSDEPAVTGHPLAADFAQTTTVPTGGDPKSADSIEQTQLARLFAEAVDWLQHAEQSFLLWVHARAMNGPWDAPLELRNRFADEEDPVPPELVEVPCRTLPADYDPDELLGIMHAYAGQVTLVDACLGVLLDAVASSPRAAESLLVVTSCRGFPLGEHRRIGAAGEALYGELLHVPWLVRRGDGVGAMERRRALVQPPDMYATLLDWYGLPAPAVPDAARSLLPPDGSGAPMRQTACTVAGLEKAIRTPAWFLRRAASSSDAEQSGENVRRSCLFAKPDDWWEVNEVSDRCGRIVDELDEALDRFEAAARAGRLAQLPPLPQTLIEGP